MSKYERLARFFKIITLLRSRSNLHRGDLAVSCEVCVRTIQRDINSLTYAGVPIFHSEKGYEIMPDFFLPPLNLSLEEAFHLVVAARTFSQNKEKSQQEVLESAISKIIARLPDETRNRLEAVLNKATTPA